MYRRCLIVLLLTLIAVPAWGQSDPETAEIGLYVVDILRLDELESTFAIELDVITSWTDPRRATGEEVQFRNDAAKKFLESGWRTDAFVTNAKSGWGVSLMHTVLHPDGRIVNRARIDAILRAPLDFREFPFDQQVLPIHVESLGHDAGELRLVVDETFSGFDSSFEMPEWDVLGTDARVTTKARSQERREFSRLEFKVSVQRRLGYYVWKVILPLLIITAISWVVFWMSSETLGRRAGISSTGMLTVIAYQFIIAGSLPRFPYLTVLDQIALLALVLISLTMAVNMFTARMDESSRLRFDRACRIAFPSALVIGLGAILAPVL